MDVVLETNTKMCFEVDENLPPSNIEEVPMEVVG